MLKLLGALLILEGFIEEKVVVVIVGAVLMFL